MKKQQNSQSLFQKYIDQTITPQELVEWYVMLQQQHKTEQLDVLLKQHFADDKELNANLAGNAERLKDKVWQSIHQHINPTLNVRFIRLKWWKRAAVAAAVLLVAAGSLYVYQTQTLVSTKFSKTPSGLKDIQPGGNRATLTASNGVVYNLKGDQGGIIVEGNNIHYQNGVVLASEKANDRVSLSTPRGGQYKVTLSDGTKVWLNAASSIVYPTSFAKNERRVELVGEAYFEVTHHPEQPFIVVTKNQEVKVLGTSFNVNAYSDENKTVTTLLTGSVQLQTGHKIAAKLTPGQQAVLKNENFDIENVDATIFNAWKDGEFRFKATSLVEVLKQIERWYDLDIDYANIPSDIYIHAEINRNRQLSTVLNALEKITDLKFEVKGRSVKIMQ